MNAARVSAWLRASAPQWLLLFAAVVATSVASPSFLALTIQDGRLVGGLVDVLTRGAPVMLLSMGMALVVATRGVDLSVGAVMAISGAVVAVLVDADVHWVVALASSVAAGVACGIWNGGLVVWLGIESIVATLILLVAGRGVAQLLSDGRIVTFVDPHVAFIGSGSVLGLPAPVVFVMAVVVLLVLFCRATAFGLFVEAVGINPAASRLAGIRHQSVLLSVYAISGTLAAIAGIIAAADIRAADANNAGLWLELDAILAVVIGRGSLLGGRFSITRSVLGALTLQTVKTGILRAGLPPEFNFVVMAVAVAVVLCLQSPVLGGTWARVGLRVQRR